MENRRALVLHEMWCAGASAEDIGRRFGVSTSTVYKWAAQYKLPARAKPQQAERGNPTPEQIAERAAECRAKHMAQRRAEDVSNTQSKVSKWRAGICQPR